MLILMLWACTRSSPVDPPDPTDDTDLPPPPGRTTIDVSSYAGCAAHDRRGLVCWGLDKEIDHDTMDTDRADRSEFSLEYVPSGCPVQSLGLEYDRHNYISENHSLISFGNPYMRESQYLRISPPYRIITADGAPCFVRDNGALYCTPLTMQADGAPTGNDFVDVDCGDPDCVARRADGTIVRWGEIRSYTAAFPTDGTWRDILREGNAMCGVRTSGEVVCTEPNPYAPRQGLITYVPPPGDWVRVVTDGTCVCALDTHGRITCTSRNDDGSTGSCNLSYGHNGFVPPPTDDGYVDLALSASTGCAIKADGAITCWGDNRFGERDAPATVPPPPQRAEPCPEQPDDWFRE